jgi:CBS domain containing-hemolysin-like protein
MEVILSICLIAGLALVSFLFAAAESAFFSLSQWQTRRLAKEHPGHGEQIARLLGQPQELISSLALGSTFANCVILGLGLRLTIGSSTAQIIGYGLLLLTVILGFCEILPKTLAVRSPERWALRLANPVWIFQKIALPVRGISQRLVDLVIKVCVPKKIKPNSGVSDEEYAELLDWAYQQGVLDRSERDAMQEIIQLDRRTAEDVMKPRSEMASIDDDLTPEEMIAAARKHKFTRLPIFDETPDTIVGVLNTRKLLLDPKADLAEAIEFPSFVPASMNLFDLLRSMQRQRRGLAIVVDEFGGTAGLVTVEDILEEMVGEIRDEGEKAEFTVEKLDRNRWRVNGMLPVEDFQKIYPALKGLQEVDTMGGLLVALKEVVPRVGESATIDGLQLIAVVADDRRVRELVVKRSNR